MKRKIKKCALLVGITLALSGCVAVQVEEGQIPAKPEITQVPQKTEVPVSTEQPEAPEVGGAIELPESTEAPAATQEPVQDEAGNAQEDAISDIIRNAYESCKEIYDGIYPEEIKALTVCAATEEHISVNIAVEEIPEPADYYHMELVCENGQWSVSEFTGLCAKNGPYAEELISLEPLACDSVEFPEDTVVSLAMGSTVGVDLDGDGMQEMVQVTFGSVCGSMENEGKPTRNTLYHELPVVRINDYIFDEECLHENVGYYAESADIATWYILDVDVKDGYKEIGLYEHGPSGDPYTTLFRYEDGKLRKIGGFSDEPADASMASWVLKEDDDYQELLNSVKRGDIRIQVPGDGMIFAAQRVDILETSFVEGMWKLQNSESFEEARLELQVREEYTFKGYEYRMTDVEYCPMVREELQVFSDKDFTSQIMVLAQGEKVIPYRYYPDKEEGERNGWVELKYGEDFKTSGWIYVTNQMNICQTNEDGGIKDIWSGDLLENLSFVD